jgi:hypothetical protein
LREANQPVPSISELVLEKGQDNEAQGITAASATAAIYDQRGGRSTKSKNICLNQAPVSAD